MTNHSYFGQNGTLTYKRVGETSATGIAIVQNWKANIEFETSDLYGIGSIFRQGAARYNAKVTVSCEFCAIPDSLGTSLVGYIINPNGTGASTSATGADTTELAMFEFTGTFTDSTGTVTKTITVSNVYFSNFPWEASTGEWIKVNLEGTGNSYSITDGTVSSSA